MSCRTHCKLLIALALLIILFSLRAEQAQSQQYALAGPAEADATINHAASPGGVGVLVSPQYVIGPNDVLAVDVWKEAELTRVVPVRPDGNISLPLIGDVGASGLTPAQLQARLTEKLRVYLEHPAVTVIVQQANSYLFNVMGEVQKPGAYAITRPTTVLDALAMAGGFRDFAKETKVYVLRMQVDGTHERLPFNYRQVIKGEKLAQNVQLRPGDTVVVP